MTIKEFDFVKHSINRASNSSHWSELIVIAESSANGGPTTAHEGADYIR